MYTNVHQQNNCQSLTNRSYGFKELAVLYFPNIAPASASIRLKQWIKALAQQLLRLQPEPSLLGERPAARGKSTSPDKRLPQRGTEGG